MQEDIITGGMVHEDIAKGRDGAEGGYYKREG